VTWLADLIENRVALTTTTIVAAAGLDSLNHL
jgi:hypothetical protein